MISITLQFLTIYKAMAKIFMTLLWKFALYLVVLCIMSVHCSWPVSDDNDVSDDSDDEKKLKEALLLVDLLKHEYIRTMRENRELRPLRPIEIAETTIAEESTCATTDQSKLTLVTTTFPTLKKSPTTATVVTRKVKYTKLKKNSSASTRTIGLKSYRRAGGAVPSSQRFSGHGEGFQQHMSPEAERKNIASDVQAQIASELLSEIKIEHEFNSKTRVKTMKPTLKVHLGGSTRLPIPLPENHAFCYTNPRSPLCRTSI